jgi:succinate dehydrogenase / fumarate reductase flavoprotein subunit
VTTNDLPPLPSNATDGARAELANFLSGNGPEPAATIRDELQQSMMDLASVSRNAQRLSSCLTKVRELRDRFQRVRPADRGERFNTDLLETLEIGYLLDVSEGLVVSALARTEIREDFPQRDDVNWLRHTFLTRQNGETHLDYKPVKITRFQPKPRTY